MALTARSPASGLHLTLLNIFELRTAEGSVVLPLSAQRLVALLALRVCRMDRETLALTLWGEELGAGPTGSLRSVLYRLRRVAPWSVLAGEHWLQINPDVTVDVTERRQMVAALQERRNVDLAGVGRINLDSCLLPNWDGEWVEPYRRREAEFERHARDCLAELLVQGGRFADAVDVALISIARDSLWERPYRIVAAAHLQAGNPAQAVLVFEEYRDLVVRELAVDPSEQFMELLARVRRTSATTPRRMLPPPRAAPTAAGMVPHTRQPSSSNARL